MPARTIPIDTPSLRLRVFAPDDAAAAHRLSKEPAYRAWLSNQVYADEPEARSALEYLIGQCSDPGDPRHGPYVLAVEHQPDAVLIGHVGFSPLDSEVEIGFSIAEAYQRRGLATEAIVAASRWALEAFDLPRIVALAAASNMSSRSTLLRAGFLHAGDRSMEFQGAVQEVSLYALARAAGGDHSS